MILSADVPEKPITVENLTTDKAYIYIFDTYIGFIKFTIELTNWKWCGTESLDDNNCKKGKTQETGKYVDFTISIKGESSAQEEPEDDNNGIRYSLGGDSDIQFSQMVSHYFCMTLHA